MRYKDFFVPEYAMVPEDVYFTNWKNYTMDAHTHSVGGIEFNYITQGVCSYYVNDVRYVLKKKDLILINSNIPHKLVFASPDPCLILGMSCGQWPWQSGYVVMRELMEAHPIVAKFVEDFDEVRVIHNASELLPVMKEIEKEVRNEWNAAYIQSLCNKLIVDVARIFDKDDPRTFDHISRISDYIAYHYFEIESIEDIADAVGLNKVYMQRIFHEKREMTVGQFLKKTRLTRAASILKDTSLPIHEVEELAGFHSRQAFYTSFREMYGMSPRQYRDQPKCNK